MKTIPLSNYLITAENPKNIFLYDRNNRLFGRDRRIEEIFKIRIFECRIVTWQSRAAKNRNSKLIKYPFFEILKLTPKFFDRQKERNFDILELG